MVKEKATAEPENFADKLVVDPKNPPRTTLIFGWIGKSPSENFLRLFLRADLRSYLDIPEESVLHIEDAPRNLYPIGGSFVWVTWDWYLQARRSYMI